MEPNEARDSNDEDIAHPSVVAGLSRRGAVIIPAYNEGTIIRRTLLPLSKAAVDGVIELIVVCNGCTDDTADVARAIPGVEVLELNEGSKPLALNAGDAVATLWPRLYLDADVQISAAAVIAVLDRLAEGDVLVARPLATYDSSGATAWVRAYYRARERIPERVPAMWRAGAYGLSERGHARFGVFPLVTGDDLYVDTRFEPREKAVVATDPSVRITPADASSLMSVLRRHKRGGAELRSLGPGQDRYLRDTGLITAFALLTSIRGVGSAIDTGVFLAMALAARLSYGTSEEWERDDSSRTDT